MARRKPRKTSPLPPAGEGPGVRQRDAGRFAALARPWLLAAAAALWVARPLFPSESAAVHGDGLPAVMLWIALAVIWLLGEIGQPRFRLRFGWVDFAVLLLVAWHSIAAVWAAAHLSPRPAVNMLWEWVGFAVSFLVTRQLVTGPREARAMMAVMCSLAVALAAFGLYQYGYEMPATRAAYEADPDRALAEANLWYPPGSPQREQFEKRLASVEPMATFALTNSLAGLLAPWLIVLLGIMVRFPADAVGRGPSQKGTGTVAVKPHLEGRRYRGDGASPLLRLTPLARFGREAGREGIARFGPAACALVVAACLLLTKSRSAYLALLFGLVLLRFAWRTKAARTAWKFLGAMAALVAILAAAAIAAGGLDIEVLSEAAKSLGYRGQYWQGSLAMIADHPLMGCGPGNFQDAYKAHKLPEASEEIADPHNFLIEVWATAGTPAMLALVAALVGFFVTVVRRGRATSQTVGPDAGKQHHGFVYAGGLAGFALVIPVSGVSVAPPESAFFLLAIPVAGCSAAMVWPWVARGRLSAGLAAIGVAVLLVNLFAAGGIGFAGVAGSLWLLMAVGLNLTEEGEQNSLPGWCAMAALAGAGALAVACYASGYGPVLRSRAAMRLAERHPAAVAVGSGLNEPSSEKYLLEAAHADPLSAEPWNQLASAAFARWEANPSDDALRRFESYSEGALARVPNSSSAWETTGDRYLRVWERTKQPQHLERAVAALRQAVDLYPNSASIRVKLATALKVAGDEAGYEAQRDEALGLDELTPHMDKKLPAELRKSLQRTNSRQR